MVRPMAEVADRRADEDPLPSRTLRRLREAVGQVGRFVVAPAAHVHDADAVAAAVADDPVQAALDVLVDDAPHRPALDEDEPRLGRHPAIKPAREAAISARDHGRHRAVPRRLVIEQGGAAARPPGTPALAPEVNPVARAAASFSPRPGHVHVGEDPVFGLHEVGVRIEARVQERDRHPAAAVLVERAQPQGSGQDGARRRSVAS